MRVALESGRDVGVNRLLQSELALVPKSLAMLDGGLQQAGNLDLGTSARAKHAPLLMKWRLFSPAPLFRSKNLCNVTSQFSFGQLYRFGVLFDRYVKNSIKGVTRDKGKEMKSTGIRRNVDNRDQRMGNWERFILEDNMTSLAHFLSTEISESSSAPPGQEVLINEDFKDTLKVWSSDTS